ncbi:mechanosensitive ion channel domain-containing protein [Falsirhodobacter sp. 20TX0035]|uniref:mechanosensitive ion channel domain-containing protein n=1 Tax=Falsirhodobacter sp. 20TX0035 TaxID=3022019 RepID=UPI00232F35EB|nr:mechanosensitive ion channel domain-containing protein [Falsirhodobacter sp. 20TX0035]MDB6452399.1 mechanosensitive ion channel [Falsirhodobacter sp. 20TX0035]
MTLRTLLAALAIALLPLTGLAQALPGAATTTAPTIPPEEAVQRLLDVLQDDQARTALIDTLKADTTAAGAATPATAEEEPPPALAQQVAESTAAAGRELVGELARVGQQLVAGFGIFTEMQVGGAHRAEAIQLFMTIFTTIVIAALLMHGANILAGRHSPPPTAGFWKRTRTALLITLVRAAGILLAWTAGYALASFVFSRTGSPSAAQTLYLNAFLLFGGVRVILRAISSPNADDEPTMSVLAPGAQAIIYRNLVIVSGIVIQGLLFVVPLMRVWIGFAAVRPVRTIVATLAAIAAIIAIRRIARALDLARGDRFTGEMDAGSAVAMGAQRTWRTIWPALALIYIAYSWFIVVTRPALIETVILRGTVYTILAVFLLLIGMRLMRSAAHVNVSLPETLLALSPALARRTNMVAMILLWVASVFLMLFALSLALSGWGWVDASLLGDPIAQAVLWRVLSALLLAVIAAVIWAMVDGWIEYKLTHGINGQSATNRTRTLLSLFRNGFTIALVVVATMITLSQIGINIAPLIAGAGVIGLAVGFGAQTLVKDVITGVFIQLENAINVGDVVEVGAVSGGVEKVNIRTVRLRAANGSVHIVPFSSVTTVTNMTRDFGAHVMDIGVAYREDITRAKAALQEAYDRLIKEPDFAEAVIAPLDMQGVMGLGPDSVNLRVIIKTLPAKHWGVGRRYTELVKEVMDEWHIEIPFPQRQLHLPEGFEKMLAGGPQIEGKAVSKATT